MEEQVLQVKWRGNTFEIVLPKSASVRELKEKLRELTQVRYEYHKTFISKQCAGESCWTEASRTYIQRKTSNVSLIWIYSSYRV